MTSLTAPPRCPRPVPQRALLFPTPRAPIGGWVLLMACVLLACWTATCQAALSLYPLRVELEGRQRAAQVDILNTGTTPQTYRISLVRRRMTDQGEIVAADEPLEGERFADDLVRFSPRQVTVAPGRSQTVRLLLRKPSELDEGEYRAHLHVHPVDVPPEGPGAGAETQTSAAMLHVRLGASIPVIVRHGSTRAELSVSSLSFEPAAGSAAPALRLQLDRSGNRSVFGDLSAILVPRQGQPVEVARAAGVAVYVPNALRQMRLPLSVPPGLDLSGAHFRVTFRQRVEAGGRLLAEGQLPLP